MTGERANIPKQLKAAVSTTLGPAAADALEGRFGAIVAGTDLPSEEKLRKHLLDGILPGFALYRLLRDEGRTQAEALASVDAIFKTWFAPRRSTMQRLGRLPFIFPVLRLIIRQAMKTYPAGGWRIDWLENSAERVRFDMRSCYYHERLRALGAPELTPSFCAVDEFVYGALAPRVEFRRAITIARGAQRCDFCFAREGAPAAAPD